MSEADIQKNLIKHLGRRAQPDMVWLHVNNTPRNKIHGRQLKQMGLIKGAPDLLYFYRGLFFAHELKTEIGRLSPDQKIFHERFERAGGQVIVSYGDGQALEQLVDIGLIRGGL